MPTLVGMTSALRRLVVSGVLATALAVPLVGCSGSSPIDNLVGGAVDRAIEDIVPEGLDLTTDGQLPEGFPSAVPLVDGEVIGGAAGAGAGWTAIIQPASADTFAEAESKLTAVGFTVNASNSDTGSAFGSYSGNGFNVQLTYSTDGEGLVTAVYVVTPQ